MLADGDPSGCRRHRPGGTPAKSPRESCEISTRPAGRRRARLRHVRSPESPVRLSCPSVLCVPFRPPDETGGANAKQESDEILEPAKSFLFHTVVVQKHSISKIRPCEQRSFHSGEIRSFGPPQVARPYPQAHPRSRSAGRAPFDRIDEVGFASEVAEGPARTDDLTTPGPAIFPTHDAPWTASAWPCYSSQLRENP